jgi:hypothetical protein
MNYVMFTPGKRWHRVNVPQFLERLHMFRKNVRAVSVLEILVVKTRRKDHMENLAQMGR